MPERRLREILAELHEQLEDASDLDDAARAALRETAAEIRDSLDAADSDGPGEGLRDRLADALARFGGDHPKLTETVTRLVDQLSDMGI